MKQTLTPKTTPESPTSPISNTLFQLYHITTDMSTIPISPSIKIAPLIPPTLNADFLAKNRTKSNDSNDSNDDELYSSTGSTGSQREAYKNRRKRAQQTKINSGRALRMTTALGPNGTPIDVACDVALENVTKRRVRKVMTDAEVEALLALSCPPSVPAVPTTTVPTTTTTPTTDNARGETKSGAGTGTTAEARKKLNLPAKDPTLSRPVKYQKPSTSKSNTKHAVDKT